MATLSQADSKRKYSWWWDSHISPKNSKWLQENLTDMDAKVKQMIKLIEEDADSFARRAEMYYKQRPELMKLVEEFYRAYRALAERYDHATGALRQAHRTMAEAFPNQVPFVLADDSPAGSANEMTDPQTPDMPTPIRAMFDPDELQKDALGLSSHFHALKKNEVFTEESDTVTIRKGLKQLNDLFGSVEAGSHAKFSEGKARKGLNFQDAEEKERSVQNNGSHNMQARVLSGSERLGKAEAEISTLKKTLAKFEAEKEAGLLQYQESLERLSNLESEISHAQEDSKGLSERASKAEAEVQTLKESLAKLESERETSLIQYQQCLDRISNLENNISRAEKDAGELNERASKAEVEAEAIKQDLVRVEAEKEAVLAQYKKCLEMISNLEDKLLHAEENARTINERANKAECEVETLKQALAKLTEEKKAAALQYQQSLEMISSLEQKISCAQEEAQRLNTEINDGVAKLNGAEEKCLLLENSNQSLQSELESLVHKMGSQSEELTEKQKELGRLWTCIQEERLRFVEAETAFQTLQHLHSQSQEELRSLAAELRHRNLMVKDMETCNQGLMDEVQKVKEENKSLNELNLSSAVSIRNLQDEIFSLRETIGKLEEQVLLRVDQRNALQQEIYCLKEELKELNKKHRTMLEQVESVGFDADCFGSSVKELQDENSKLKENCEAERSERVALLEKLEIMKKLKEKNAFLENSLSDLNVELEGVRGKVKELEESCQSLFGEKSTLVAEKATLVSQLQITTNNLDKLSEGKNFLENSLFDANAELEAFRVKLKVLEGSCQLLDTEKFDLITERESLVSQLDISKQRLEDLEKRYTVLEYEHSSLEKERESALHNVEQLQASLDAAKQEHIIFSRLSETRLAAMELQICVLEEEGQCRKKEYEEEVDKAVSAQMEIFVLQKCVNDLKDKIFSLLIECQKLLEGSRLSEKLISELEHENLEQQMEVKSLFEQIKKLRTGLYQVLKTLGIDADQFEDKINQDEAVLSHILCKLQETQNSLSRSYDENQQLLIEKSVLVTLLGQLKVDGANLVTERDTLAREFMIRCEQSSLLQTEIQKLLEMSEYLRLKVMEGEQREKVLTTETENLSQQLLDLQRANQNLQEENCKVLEEKRSLSKEVLDLGDEKHNLEEAHWALFGETMSQCNLSLIFNNIVFEKFVELEELTKDLVKLRFVTNDLEEKLRIMEGKYDGVKMENSDLKELVNNLENEIVSVKSASDQLRCEVVSGKDLLCHKKNELSEAEQREKVLTTETENLSQQLLDLQRANQNLQEENCKVLEEKRSLSKEVLDLGDEKHNLEEAHWALFGETMSHCNLSLIFNNIVFEKFVELEELTKDLVKLRFVTNDLEEKLRIMEGKYDGVKMENSDLKELVNNLENEIVSVKSASDQLRCEVVSGKDLLCHKKNELSEAEQREKVLTTETENLSQQLLDLQRANQNLQEENCKVLEEKRSLSKEVLDLGDEKHNLEEAHWALFGETMSHCNLSLIFNNIVFEKFVELEELTEDLVKLRFVTNDLEEKLRIMEGKYDGVKMENSDLKELVNNLENEIVSVKSASDQLRCEVVSGKDLLCRKKNELLEAEQIISAITNEKTELHNLVEDLKNKYDEAKIREERLGSELQKGRHEIELWESQAATFFSEQQSSSVCEVLFEGKIRELIEACESLEDRSNSKDMKIELLKDRISTLEFENGGLQAQLAAYTPAVISFKNCISSLEKHALFNYKPLTVENKEAMDAHLMTHPIAESYQQRDEDQISMEPDGFSDLQDVQRRIKAIEKAVVEAERLAMLEHLNTNAKLETALREIEELKSQSRLSQEYVVTSKHITPYQVKEELGDRHSNDLKLGKQTREISEARNEVLTKDIMLDQVSDCSSYGISRRETLETDQMLELWETANREGSIDLRVGKSQKAATAKHARNQIGAVKEHKHSYPSSESLFEKELGVDKLEISDRQTEPSQEGNKRKILERLDSDAQKLTNLQITVEDLKRKVGITEKSKKGRGIEFDTVKVQLDESEESIMKLFDVNRKLMKTVENSSLSFDGISAIESDESGNARRRKISEQARRGSDKIGRLQLEVQKVQFLLLKLDDDKEGKGKTRISDRKPRVLLSDYLYGGVRTSHKRKKAPFCACVRPPTKGD